MNPVLGVTPATELQRGAELRSLDLRRLRYFVAVAEMRNFRAAAQRLFMAQPPLSQQIRALEDELGVQLLVRTTRSVELTPAGAVLLQRARAILREVDAAARDTILAQRGEVGRLAVGFTGSVTYELLPMLARQFRQLRPGVELALHGEMLTGEQVAALAAGELDVALLRPPVRHPRLTVQVVRTEPLVVAVPSGHAAAAGPVVRLEDLAGEPFVSYPTDGGSVVVAVVNEACRRAGFEPTVAIEVKETSTLVSFVAAGFGVALVPGSVRHLRVTGVEYVELSDADAAVELALAWDPSNSSPTLGAFVELATQLVGNQRPDLRVASDRGRTRRSTVRRPRTVRSGATGEVPQRVPAPPPRERRTTHG